MPKITIPFWLNAKPGTLAVYLETDASPTQSGFDLFATSGIDLNLCHGYPSLRASIDSYSGTGYATASAWIQIVTRREFATTVDVQPVSVEVSVDTHPVLVESGVPFFAFGFPAEIFDAPCDNLNGAAGLDWLADTYLVTLPTRANDFTIGPVAGFRWGYHEVDLTGGRKVETRPIEVTDATHWDQHLILLRSQFGKWRYGPFDPGPPSVA